MKKLFGISLLLNFLAALNKPGTVAPLGHIEDLSNEPVIKPKRLTEAEREEKQKGILKEHGVTEFNVDGIWVMAINRKNAVRKARKIRAEMQMA